MWVTFVRDVFASGEAGEVRAALEDIASPLDAWGWSSNAVYTFWNPEQRVVLYIGLAVDVSERFAQHLGLRPCPAKGCKREQIATWFDSHRTIGYSVILQSTNQQPIVRRLAKHLGLSGAQDEDLQPHELQYLEGRFIEAYRQRHGHLPRWNEVGGSREGQRQIVGISTDKLFEIMTGEIESLLVARPSIRQLADSATAVIYEQFIHTARLRAAMAGNSGEDLSNPRILKELARLSAGSDETGRRLIVEGWLTTPSAFGAGREDSV